MYLTRLALNPQRRAARRLLASPQALHAAVLASFSPDQSAAAPEEGRVLWRVDSDGHDVRLLVASPKEPDLTHLVEQAGWPTTTPWLTRPYAPLLDRLVRGQVWAFRLRANPVHQVREPATDDSPARPRDRGKRLGHVTVAQQTAWLTERAAKHGFVVRERPDGPADVVVTHRDRVVFRRQSTTVTLATAQFDGTLEVHDPDAFRRVLVGGLGPAKAYGCGLLTVARPPT